jgi:hypothetical protein
MAAVPTIHLNGSSAPRLLSNLAAAASALRTARRALDETHPNMRDFYPQGDGAFSVALAEHTARLVRVEETLREVSELQEAILYQIETR